MDSSIAANDYSTKFKNSNGVRFLKELFFETALNKDNVIYTLKDVEHRGYPSLYQAYMEVNDPTEYSFAMQYLDGWTHWKDLTQCSFFKEYVSRWREELELRAKSQALAGIMKDSQGTTKDAYAARRYIVEKGWDKNVQTKGRPSKAAVQAEAQRIAENDKRVSEDFERLVN